VTALQAPAGPLGIILLLGPSTAEGIFGAPGRTGEAAKRALGPERQRVPSPARHPFSAQRLRPCRQRTVRTRRLQEMRIVRSEP
jgi:hypothetical protein